MSLKTNYSIINHGNYFFLHLVHVGQREKESFYLVKYLNDNHFWNALLTYQEAKVTTASTCC